jgi:hypothetical protein
MGDGGSLPRRRRAEKNREIFRIFPQNSHNQLSARCLGIDIGKGKLKAIESNKISVDLLF